MQQVGHPPTEGHQTVERAFEVLEVLAAEGPQGVTGLAARLGLEKSTASRLLKTLGGLGYAVQNGPRGTYQLGPRVLFLAERYLDENRLAREARPVLKRLSQEARASAHLARQVGAQFLVVAKEASPEQIQVASEVGAPTSPHASALGKVLLAAQAPAARRDFCVFPLQRFTEKTLVEPRALEAELEAVSRRGYALETGEEHPGVGCIGAPVRDAGGHCVAALSISGPIQGTPFRLDKAHIRMLTDAAAELSRRMGHGNGPRED
ncbi:MAG: IclR family transcriptional regulator [Planctomycetota bacterium]|nr:IclR family transcriptional regulator [Planctomycetota bacterium]